MTYVRGTPVDGWMFNFADVLSPMSWGDGSDKFDCVYNQSFSGIKMTIHGREWDTCANLGSVKHWRPSPNDGWICALNRDGGFISVWIHKGDTVLCLSVDGKFDTLTKPGTYTRIAFYKIVKSYHSDQDAIEVIDKLIEEVS